MSAGYVSIDVAEQFALQMSRYTPEERAAVLRNRSAIQGQLNLAEMNVNPDPVFEFQRDYQRDYQLSTF